MSALQEVPPSPPPLPDTQPAKLLRVFVGESERHHNHPLYESIVLKARDMHMAGATVLRGHLGYGQSQHLHTQKILRLSDDLPVIVEIVDKPEKIDAFVTALDDMMTRGLVTVEPVRVVQRKPRHQSASA